MRELPEFDKYEPVKILSDLELALLADQIEADETKPAEEGGEHGPLAAPFHGMIPDDRMEMWNRENMLIVRNSAHRNFVDGL